MLHRIIAVILIFISLASLCCVLFFSVSYLGLLGICECFDIALYAKVIAADALITIILLINIVLVFVLPALFLLDKQIHDYWDRRKRLWFLAIVINVLLTIIAYWGLRFI